MINQSGNNQTFSSSSSYTEALVSSSSAVVYATPCKTKDVDVCEYGTLLDALDNQIYKTLTIGNQTWMAENLRYESDESYCASPVDSCLKYGRIYTWTAALNACPKEWHLPSYAEWKEINEILLSTIPLGHTVGEYGFVGPTYNIYKNVMEWTSSTTKEVGYDITYSCPACNADDYHLGVQFLNRSEGLCEENEKLFVRCVKD
jgi:uncharacterized protein (TIGR02145 family)